MRMPETINRTGQVFLVELGDRYALVDRGSARVHLINTDAAWVWTRLGTAAEIPEAATTAVTAFLDELAGFGLTGGTGNSGCPAGPAGFGGAPRIIDSTPLQVAANNSPGTGDPFFGP